jgi:hypothetical protein
MSEEEVTTLLGRETTVQVATHAFGDRPLSVG